MLVYQRVYRNLPFIRLAAKKNLIFPVAKRHGFHGISHRSHGANDTVERIRGGSLKSIIFVAENHENITCFIIDLLAGEYVISHRK